MPAESPPAARHRGWDTCPAPGAAPEAAWPVLGPSNLAGSPVLPFALRFYLHTLAVFRLAACIGLVRQLARTVLTRPAPECSCAGGSQSTAESPQLWSAHTADPSLPCNLNAPLLYDAPSSTPGAAGHPAHGLAPPCARAAGRGPCLAGRPVGPAPGGNLALPGRPRAALARAAGRTASPQWLRFWRRLTCGPGCLGAVSSAVSRIGRALCTCWAARRPPPEPRGTAPEDPAQADLCTAVQAL